MVKRKCISIVTCTAKVGGVFRQQLEPVFGTHTDFQMCSLQAKNISDVCGDLVLVPGPGWTKRLGSFLSRDIPIVLARRTLERGGLERVMSLPSKTKAMLVNNDREAAFETVSSLYQLGVRHIELIPVYPGSNIPDVDLAITPNELQCVPDRAREVIDIGDRVIDAATMIEVAARMRDDRVDLTSILERFENAVDVYPGLVSMLEQSAHAKQQLDAILDLIPEAVIGLGACEEIALLNRQACKLFNEVPWRILGRPLRAFVSADDRWSRTKLVDEVLPLDGRMYIVNKVDVKWGQKAGGGIMTLRETQAAHGTRVKDGHIPNRGGYVAKYTFDDITGSSPAIRHAIEMAKRFSRRESAVLITGSSGTGKELFAHAIHNCSARRRFPFVAVNCGAIPKNLLESELFGYEEGAFTGARRGGKPGLFEQANKGTVFLDEISDLPLELQSRLLRVLQEKEVMRVGGTGVSAVDVRVICATNKDLTQLVEGGEFRTDLLYRIGVLSLSLPDLCERIEDVPDLVFAMLKKRNETRKVPAEVLKVLSSYRWPGNIRELDNCIEYMLSVSDNTIGLAHLPPHILKALAIKITLDLQPGSLMPDASAVLQAIGHLAETGENTGRRSITGFLKERGMELGENRVRRILRTMRNQGYVFVGPGRSGTVLTPEGAKLTSHTK